MPKLTKLHAKGKTNTIQKHHKADDASDNADPEETMRQFQLELCWCIQQLERTLNEKKGTEKQLNEAWKVLTVLKNNTQPIIRKRQLMRTHFGDYRAKMLAEEKKLAKMASKMKITESMDKPKATFLRKSAFLSTGDSSFRFNFNLAPEEVDNSSVRTEEESNQPIEDKIIKDSTKTVKDVNTSKDFKFTFSGSDFKFNFNADNS
ncbi:UPF0488 protein CG14286 [Ostrinia furnacalis]|uniref:UPF0488 protein CG14286 n=1 Tax=Ostrinia furnacalis TaxID=93504 RepID=UPI00103B313E|nr:UPF0488 protein CG14286 [Ostrinia furnacalis]